MSTETATAELFLLPDVGEGLTEAEIISWHVAVGDTVEINDVLVEIETEKSVVELPSPHAGTVLELLAAEGETAQVGSPIVRIGSTGSESPESGAGSTESAPTGSPSEPAEPRPSVLVGYGPTESHGRRRRQPAARPPGAPAAPDAASTSLGVRTKPPVRRLAKDLGVDLSTVAATGPEGLITRGDVEQHARTVAPAETPPAEAEAAPTSDARQTRIPIKGVRKATATAMVTSAFTAPHVTEFVTVDVTRAVKLVDKLKAEPAFDGSCVTMLLLVARALLAAVREFPDINASWDDDAGEIVLHHQVNLGIAAATPRGLLVPNIKDAGSLNLPGLAAALTGLVATARDGRTAPADMSRGTITITNIGVFGVDAGTPILNPGEAAILCVGAVRRTPWEHRGRVALRWTTTLALSFDHRLVDGALGSRVLARVGRILQNPRWELLMA